MLRSFNPWLSKLLAVVMCAAWSSVAFAIPTAVYQSNNTSQVFYPASATDLIDQSQPSFLSETSTGFATFAGSSTANLNNSTVGASGSNPDLAFDLDGAWTTTFDLDLTNAIFGYNINRIEGFAGWTTSNYGQRFEVLLSEVNSAAFTSLGTFTNNPPVTGSNHSTRTIITDSLGGTLGENIDAIRFIFSDPGAPSGSGGMRELDVFGSIFEVPEPGTLAILSTAMISLAGVRRRRRRAVG